MTGERFRPPAERGAVEATVDTDGERLREIREIARRALERADATIERYGLDDHEAYFRATRQTGGQ